MTASPYIVETEQRLKRLFAAYEGMSKIAKPQRARQRWDRAKGPDSHFQILYQQMAAELGERAKRVAADPKVPQTVSKLLSAIAFWPPAERRVFWARLTGMRWDGIVVVVTARQMTLAQVQELYARQISQLGQLLNTK